MSRTNDLIEGEDAETLVGLVMKLTGGYPSPETVRAQIKNWRTKIAAERAVGTIGGLKVFVDPSLGPDEAKIVQPIKD